MRQHPSSQAARLGRMRRAGSFTSGLAQLVEKMRYLLYGKHPRTTIDASSGATRRVRAPPRSPGNAKDAEHPAAQFAAANCGDAAWSTNAACEFCQSGLTTQPG